MDTDKDGIGDNAVHELPEGLPPDLPVPDASTEKVMSMPRCFNDGYNNIRQQVSEHRAELQSVASIIG